MRGRPLRKPPRVRRPGFAAQGPPPGRAVGPHGAARYRPPAIFSIAAASVTSRSVTPPASWVESVTATVL